ncbi:LTA synthase family protein [Helicobacter canis]|uniref:Phosphoglycerol transferase I n=1 Tax=Helicobacter canis TaxID=29419 RepID=A0A377J3E1_9HELI|nr:LTA synthase family protein [Helicobacter canis]STO97017.1 phosphoglycerol transferase I [Helicobacter canis]
MKNSTSNTAIPRILEQKQQLESKSVDKKQTQPLVNPTASKLKLESTFEQNSHSAHNAHLSSSRALRQQGVAIHKSAQVDSSVDCHATALARNDRENSPCEKVDSRDNAENIKNLESTFDNAAQKSKKADSRVEAQSFHIILLTSTLFTQAFFARAGVFFCSFCVFFPFFATLWVRRTFGKVDLSQIIFHLRFPVAPNAIDVDFVFAFLGVALLPSLAISLALTHPSGTARVFVAIFALCKRGFVLGRGIVCKHSMLARYVLIIALGIYGWGYVGKKLKISEFIASNKAHKTYSTFYESHYKAPDIESIKQSFSMVAKPRNLLVIYMESMESSFASTNPHDFIPSIATPNLIPNLSTLASKGVSFSHIKQTIGTGWTIAGLISYNCAFPQTWLPFNAGFNDNVARYFLHSATCLGDVFSALGYEQAFFRGANADFAGSRGFFTSHNIPINDLASIEDYAQGFGDYRNDWGVKDSVLFSYVKEYLQEYAAKKDKKPFAFYVLSADTHAPGFVDKAQCDLPTSYANSLHCFDGIVGEFVEWFLQSPLAKDTTLVLLGDHLTMQQRFVRDGTSRSIYNAFINPTFTKPPTQDLLANRALSHFDITALLLDSIAIPTRAFGLGRNPLYGHTLQEQLGEDTLAAELGKPSRVYEGFWEFDRDKPTQH